MIRILLLLAAVALLLAAGVVNAQDLFAGPEGVVYDSVRNRYLVANWNDGSIVEIDSNMNQSYFKPSVVRISGLTIVGDTLFGAGQNGVVGLDLETADILSYVAFPGSQLLNALALDTSGFMYITDAGPGIIYQYNLSTHAFSAYNTELVMPVGLEFDAEANRLLVTTRPDDQASIHEVSLIDGSVTELVATGLPVFGYLEDAEDGNYFATCHSLGHIYRYNHTFSDPPILVSDGHSSPTQIYYNKLDSMLVVPNYTGHTVDFVKLVDYDTDNVYDFRDNCPGTANEDQTDNDSDGVGNACDNCPENPDPDQTNNDTDSLGNICDNCPDVTNPDQTDINANEIGDACETCCGFWTRGLTGNANCSDDGKLTLSDISRLIDRVYISREPLCCEATGNTNADSECKTTLSDITILIDAVYISKTPPAACMVECET